MTEEEKMMERFTQERVRRQKGGSASKRYNLADDDEDEQLTHMGQVRGWSCLMIDCFKRIIEVVKIKTCGT